MRVFSRDVLVGFLLVLVVVVSGCQPVQPVGEEPGSAADGAIVESGPVTDTATLSETVTVDAAAPATGTVASGSVATGTVDSGAAAGAATPIAEESEAEESEAVDPALIEAGMLVYRAQYCGVCHLLDAVETRGVFGPTHNDLSATVESYFANGIYQGAATTTSEYIRESIVDPQVFISPGFATTSHRMPSYAHLDNASIDALVALLLAQ